MATVTSFPADVVPQAPEDALFGLMRAFKADQSPDKVDLVGCMQDTATLLKVGNEKYLVYNTDDIFRESAPTETTMLSHGFYLLSRRYSSSAAP